MRLPPAINQKSITPKDLVMEDVIPVSWFPLAEIVDRLAYPDEKKLIARSGELGA